LTSKLDLTLLDFILLLGKCEVKSEMREGKANQRNCFWRGKKQTKKQREEVERRTRK
jgi:hypothetical protein